MSGMKIDFSEVESSFEPLEEGWYDCLINRIEVRESKSSEHNYLNWEFDVQDEDHEGRKLWMITSLSPKALFRLKDNLLALEIIEEDEELELEWADDVDITPQEGPLLTNPELDGLAVKVLVENEMYEGKERNRVNDVQLSDGAAPAKKAKGKAKKASGKKASGGKRKRALR